MKKMIISSAVLFTFLSAAGSFGADTPTPSNAPDQNFDQKKAGIIKHIDKRIQSLQKEKACIESAKNHEDVKACREKFKEEMEEAKDGFKKHPFMKNN